MRNGTTYRVGSLDRALESLEMIADAGEISLAELAVRTESPKSSLLRHLRVLEAGGYVTMNHTTKRYRLGARLIHLGYAARRQLGLTDVAMPLMRELRDRYDESVHLGVLSHGDVLHVAVTPSHQPLKMATPVGERTYAHISALGKILLAWGEEGVLEETIEDRGLPMLTERTITDQAALRRELERIRERGWAMDDEESAAGLRCVAAPVRDASGHVAAALSVSAPATRLTRGDAKNMAPAVIQIASAISQRLGYHGPMDGDERRGLVDAAEHELAAGRQQQLGGADERRTP
jgi:IclR family acetate operon transcriptional repressor